MMKFYFKKVSEISKKKKSSDNNCDLSYQYIYIYIYMLRDELLIKY